MTESFDDALVTVHKNRLLSGKMCNRLQRAHDHDIEQLRTEIARLSSTPVYNESCSEAYEVLRSQLEINCENDPNVWAEPLTMGALKAYGEAVEKRIQHIRKAEYHRGYEDGKRSMDAEHYQLKLRLQRLKFDDGSHENLSRLAYAIYPCPTGWGKDSCEGLRDKLIELLGGVHDEPAQTVTSSCACDADCDCGNQQPQAIAYDELDNERHKAICELRKMTIDSDYHGNYQRIALAIGTVYDGESFASECVRDRLIHLLGGDQPSGIDVLNGADLSKKSVDAMSKRANEAHVEHKDDCLTIRDGLGGELKLVNGDILLNGKSLIDALMGSTDEPDSQKSTNLEYSDGEDRITYELRGYVQDNEREHIVLLSMPPQDEYRLTENGTRLLDIADRIDEQEHKLRKQRDGFKREHQEAVNRLMVLRRERDELKKKLDGARGAIRHITNQWDISNKKRRELQKKLDTIREALDG